MKKIYTKLREDGLNPYFIGQHKGLCEEPYVVIRQGTTIPSLQSRTLGQTVIEAIVFVPSDSYVAVEAYVDSVKQSLKEVGSLRKTGTEMPVVTDDDKKAYTQMIEYVKQHTLEV